VAWYRYRGAQPATPPIPAPPRNPSKCGTPAGYLQHHYYDTQVCDPCRVANNDYKRGLNHRGRAARLRKAWTAEKCGTMAGWNAHNRHGVPICVACRAAQAAYQTAYRARKRAA
jgi:hypothetical protein